MQGVLNLEKDREKWAVFDEKRSCLLIKKSFAASAMKKNKRRYVKKREEKIKKHKFKLTRISLTI